MTTSTALSPLDLASFELHAVQPVLRVRDIVAATEWYRDVLGFTIDFVWGDPPEHARVIAVDHASRTGIQLSTFGNGTSIVEATEADPAGRGWIMMYVGNDIDGLYEHYRSRGAVVVREIADRPWGLRDFDIADPDGNVLRFAGYMPQ